MSYLLSVLALAAVFIYTNPSTGHMDYQIIVGPQPSEYVYQFDVGGGHRGY